MKNRMGKILKDRRNLVLLLVMIAVMPAVFILSLGIGTVSIPGKTSLSIITGNIFGLGNAYSGSAFETIILKLRVPRTLLGLIAGASLGLSGAVLQCLFRNPMADPYVMGLSSGAGFSVSLGIVSGLTSPLLIQLSSFSGAILSVFLVLFISGISGNRRDSMIILLTGIAVSLFFSSLMSLIMYLNHEQTEKILFWTFGSISGASFKKLLWYFPVFLAGTILILPQWKALNLLSQGDETARSLGINPSVRRIILLIITSVLTAATVSFTGIIGFVGLMVPHSIRMLTGSDHKYLLPFSAAGGAVFLVIADIISRIILIPSEIPVGIITSLIGVPYLLGIIIFRKRRTF